MLRQGFRLQLGGLGQRSQLLGCPLEHADHYSGAVCAALQHCLGEFKETPQEIKGLLGITGRDRTGDRL